MLLKSLGTSASGIVEENTLKHTNTEGKKKWPTITNYRQAHHMKTACRMSCTMEEKHPSHLTCTPGSRWWHTMLYSSSRHSSVLRSFGGGSRARRSRTRGRAGPEPGRRAQCHPAAAEPAGNKTHHYLQPPSLPTVQAASRAQRPQQRCSAKGRLWKPVVG